MGGEKAAQAVLATINDSTSRQETARALEGLRDAPGMAQDFAVMEEAQATGKFADEIAERIRRRYREGL